MIALVFTVLLWGGMAALGYVAWRRHDGSFGAGLRDSLREYRFIIPRLAIGMFGAFVLLVIIFMALFANVISPHDAYDQQLGRKLIPPIWHDSPKTTWSHPLGTDHLGRDYLSRLSLAFPPSSTAGSSTWSPPSHCPACPR